jgi:hypothetical protein
MRKKFRARAATLRDGAIDSRTDVGLVDLMMATAADMEAEAELYQAKRPTAEPDEIEATPVKP